MKILLSVTYLQDLGGIETAAMNLLHEIHDRYDVTLCVPADYISAKFKIPDNVKIIHGASYIHDVLVDRKFLLSQSFIRKCIRNVRRIFNHYIIKEEGLERALNRISVPGEYDVAIAFGDFRYSYRECKCFDYDIVLNKVKAKRKIAWMHNDPIRQGWTKELAQKRLSGFDAIVNVSNDCKRTFDELIPEFKEKSHVVYNMYDIEQIKLRAERLEVRGDDKPFDRAQDKLHFVTVCRLDERQKRVSRIVEVCKRLKDEACPEQSRRGYNSKPETRNQKQEARNRNFDWTIVGDGDNRMAYEAASRQNGTTGILHFVGLKPNPYPYMKHADAFILSSLYEGLPMTIREAQILGTPTFSTRFGAAEEAIEVGKQGDICDNSTDGLYNMVKGLLENPDVLIKYREYLRENPVDNQIAIRQFDELIIG